MLRQFEQVRIMLANIKTNVLAYERENEELRKAYTQLKNEKDMLQNKYDKMKNDYDECKRNLEKTTQETSNSES